MRLYRTAPYIVGITFLALGCTVNRTAVCSLGSGDVVAGSCGVGLEGGGILIDGKAIIVDVATESGDQILRIDTSNGKRTVLTGDPGKPNASAPFVLDGGELFFSGCRADSTCAIFAVPSTGGAVRPIVELDASEVPTASVRGAGVVGLAVDSASVYWLDTGIWSAPRGGGTAHRLDDGVTYTHLSGTALAGPLSGLAVDNSALYAAIPSDNLIKRLPLDGSASAVIQTPSPPTKILVAGGHAYWSNAGVVGGDCTAPDGSVQSWSGSGDANTIAAQVPGLADFTVVGAAVAWTSDGAYCNGPRDGIGTVSEIPPGAAAPTTLADMQREPRALGSDGTSLYAVEVSLTGTTDGVVRIPLR